MSKMEFIFVFQLNICARGGIGRRAALRGQYSQGCGSSNLLVRTIKQLDFIFHRNLTIVYALMFIIVR